MGLFALHGLRRSLDWQPEIYAESAGYLANMERGFYNMRGVSISDTDPVGDEIFESIRNDRAEETLELLQVHLGDYRDREVSASGMEQIRRTFEAYQDRRVGLIVRFLYDWEGKGAESDPSSLSVVLRHMEQMGEILEEFEDQIYIVQGVFVGSWAEMHGSRYLTGENYLTLIRKMQETVPKSVYLAVRTPAYWRTAAGTAEPLAEEEAWNPSSLSSRLSLFNDGILGNWLDCGTYGDVERENAGRLSDRWVREDELEFQNRLNLYVPNGGEAVIENSLNDFENADETFGVMHISYLNRGHDVQVLEKWKNSVYRHAGSVYDGMSGYDYIERHLGYRFVIRDVSVQGRGWSRETGQITVEIENVGYSGRYTPCRVEVSVQHEESGRLQVLTADTDVRDWRPGEKTSFSVQADLHGTGTYRVSLNVTGEKDGCSVRFANENITAEDGSCFLGTIKKGE